MFRREFFKSPMALAGIMLGRPALALPIPEDEFPKSPGLTKYVSEFIVNAKYEDIPEDVITLGKKTILDGFGLALAGSASTASPRMRKYIETTIGEVEKLFPKKIHATTLNGFVLKIALFLFAFQIEKAFI